MSLEGSLVTVRHDVNAKFYGQQVSAQALLTRPGPKAAEPLYEALNKAMQEQMPVEGLRPSTLWTNNPTCNVYDDHPDRPVYNNHQQSHVPPPIMPTSQGSCFGGYGGAQTSPQQAGSGSMESYHQQSLVIPGSIGSIQHAQFPQSHYQTHPPQPAYENTGPQTIATMNQGPPPLFNPASPGSTVGSNGQW